MTNQINERGYLFPPVSLVGIQAGDVVQHRDGEFGTVKEVSVGAVVIRITDKTSRWLRLDGTGEVPNRDVVKRLGVKATPDPVPVSLEGIQVGELVEHRDGQIGTVKRVQPGAGFPVVVMVKWDDHRWLKRDGTGEVPSRDVVKRLGVKATPDPVPAPTEASLEGVLEEVREERLYQDRRHGGPAHDDTHLRGDWQEFIEARLHDYDQEDEEYRQAMVEIAALAVAAIQSLDRKAAKRAADTDPGP